MADLTLPHFLVIGAMKAGTTRLHAHLAAHPDIGMPRAKETDFFVPEISGARDIHWYGAQFPRAPVCGEVSPNYAKALVFPGVPARIAAVLPDVRLIYILRDPVARALSEYRHKCAAGLLQSGLPLEADHLRRLVDPGLYHRQIMEYLPLIPQQRMLFVTTEQLASSPAQVLSAIARFLEVEDVWPTPAGHDNRGTTLLPGWYWRLRQSRPARLLRQNMPPTLGARLRRLAMRPGAEVPIPDDLRQRVQNHSAADVTAFRALTGLKTPGWSL